MGLLRGQGMRVMQIRVITLCQQLWPNVPSSRFLVDAGRSANDRMIGIKWLEIASIDEGENPPRRLQGDYICRIVRENGNGAPGSWTTALGRFLQRRLTFPVPIVVHLDNSGDSNPLGRPHVIQYRLAGSPLDEIFPSLNRSQKMMAALDMARLTRELMTISNPTHGTPLEGRPRLASPTLRTAGCGVFSEAQARDTDPAFSVVQTRRIAKRLIDDE